MLVNDSGSYYEEYRRSKKKGDKNKLEDERILTDRSAYITFLEVQLERVSAACLTAQSFSDRIEEVHGTVLTNDEKVNNLSRSIKLMDNKGGDFREEIESLIQSMREKVEDFRMQFEGTESTMEKVKRATESVIRDSRHFEDSQKVQLDSVKRQIEQRVLDFSSRLDLEEVRGKSNESKICGLSDLVRAETKAAVDSAQQQLAIKMSSLEEECELRFNSVNSRISKALGIVKKGTSSDDAISYRNLETIKRELMEYSDRQAEAIRDSIRRLEEKSLDDEKRRRKDETKQTERFEKTILTINSRLQKIESMVEGSQVQSQVEILQERLSKVTTEISNNVSPSSLMQTIEKAVETKVRAERERENARLQNILEGIETKIQSQSAIVSHSMTRVEDFMDLYHLANTELQDRLELGKQHQEKLKSLLQQNSDINFRDEYFLNHSMEAESEDQTSEFKTNRTPTRSSIRKRRSLSSGSCKSSSGKSTRRRSLSCDSTSKRDGGGKMGRSCESGATITRDNIVSSNYNRPPWGASTSHPLNNVKQQKTSSIQRQNRLQELYQELSSLKG